MDDLKLPSMPIQDPRPQFWEAVEYLIDHERTSWDELSRIWRKSITDILIMRDQGHEIPTDLIKNLTLRFEVSPLWIWYRVDPIIGKIEE